MKLSARLEMSLRRYRAAKRERCSMAVEMATALALSALLDEALMELPSLPDDEGAELLRVMEAARVELTKATENEREVLFS